MHPTRLIKITENRIFVILVFWWVVLKKLLVVDITAIKSFKPRNILFEIVDMFNKHLVITTI